MKPATKALIASVLSVDETLDSGEAKRIMEAIEQVGATPALVQMVDSRPLLTQLMAAAAIGTSRWTLARLLDEHTVEIPQNCMPVVVRRRPMYPPAFVEWAKQRPWTGRQRDSNGIIESGSAYTKTAA